MCIINNHLILKILYIFSDFLTVEDLEGFLPIIVFAKTYAVYRNVIFEDAIVWIEGRASIKDDDESNIVAMKIKLVSQMEEEEKKKKFRIHIPENLTETQLTELREFIKKLGYERPNTEVEIVNRGNKKTLKLLINENVIDELTERVGKTNLEWF